MGESRCKWVVVEHLKFISSLLGLHALAIDYRGFADSSGSPTETGLCTDAAAGVQWLCEHGGMRPDEVVVWAHSLGTGVAVRLALELQAKPVRIFRRDLRRIQHARLDKAHVDDLRAGVWGVGGVRQLTNKQKLLQWLLMERIKQVTTTPESVHELNKRLSTHLEQNLAFGKAV
jgi:fermentation-respiration switch protein FrsA (DUF1100 family)